MALFRYQALTEGGRLMQGSLEAASQEEARSLLSQMQVNISTLEPASEDVRQRPIGRQDFLLFNQQLAALTQAGIPLERGLRELSQDIASRKMRELVASIAEDMEAGMPMEEAFGRRERHFPALYCQLLKAGIETGQLGEMLTSLNRQVELTGQTKRIVVESLTYPALVLLITALITSYLYTSVVPAFGAVVQEMVGGRLNSVTENVFRFSRLVLPFWIVCGVMLAGLALLWSLLSFSAGGRRFREVLLINLPVFGHIYHCGALARLAETLSVTLSAGCPMPESLRTSAFATSSESLSWECENVARQIEAGQPILTAGALCRQLPRFFLYSMQLGIQRNDIPGSLHSLSRMYTEQAQFGQAHVQAILLPLFIVILGIILALTILGIFLPMIQVVSALS
jgi:type IV pilus assembly protein PilC